MMRDILTDLQCWLEEDRSIALATVIQTWGSSPRAVGSKMAFTPDGKVAGSVSGGCVENAVIDPHKAWANKERFPHVDQLIQAWPDEAFEQINVTQSTAIAMLTHDPKLDDIALKFALSSPAFYLGALGSKGTNAKRRGRLLNDGVSESRLSRLHTPIGLDIETTTLQE